jgi:hypothetical protein
MAEPVFHFPERDSLIPGSRNVTRRRETSLYPVRDQEAGGSNPLAPTNSIPYNSSRELRAAKAALQPKVWELLRCGLVNRVPPSCRRPASG